MKEIYEDDYKVVVRLAELEHSELLTAAPDMYEALSEVIAVLEILHPMNSEEPCLIYDIWHKAKQALAKAGG